MGVCFAIGKIVELMYLDALLALSKYLNDGGILADPKFSQDKYGTDLL